MITRRDFARYSTATIGGLIGLFLAIPGMAFLFTPILKQKRTTGGFTPVARFADLKDAEPQVFPVIEARQDAWVRYPAEPIGMVWLVRQPPGARAPVIALSAECPHLACAVDLAADGKSFACPCHTSFFDLTGKRTNRVSPRDMDQLEVEPFDPNDPEAVVRVKFERFRTMSETKVPLA